MSVPFEHTASTVKTIKPALAEGQIVVSMAVPLATAIGDGAVRTVGIWQGSCAELVASLVPPEVHVVSAFQSYGQYIAKSIDDEERQAIVKSACPGAGACGGMYTANTMASAIEAMGMSLPYSSSTPATDAGKILECRQVGAAIAVRGAHKIGGFEAAE